MLAEIVAYIKWCFFAYSYISKLFLLMFAYFLYPLTTHCPIHEATPTNYADMLEVCSIYVRIPGMM